MYILNFFLQKYTRLVATTTCILSFMEEKYLSGLFLTKHLGDIMAALIQLGHAPLKKPQKDGEDTTAPGKFVMTREKYDRLTEQQGLFRQKLSSLLDRVYQPMAVKYLLVIQSSGASSKSKSANAPSPAAPRWLKAVCGELLSDRLLKKSGVRNVMRYENAFARVCLFLRDIL